jgi:hypothetical protein
MMISQIGEWLDVIFKVLIAIFSIWLFFDRRNDKTNERIDAHDTRLTTVETKLEHQPTHDNLGDVHNHIRTVAEQVALGNTKLAAMEATLQSLKELTTRMDTFWRSRTQP